MKIFGYLLLLAIGLAAPHYFYSIFVMKILCFALFASAFNLLIGYTGLLSFGHAAFLGGAGYITGYVLRDLSLSPLLGGAGRHRIRGVARAGGRLACDPAPGHLFHDDHAGAVADGVLRLAAGARSLAARTACRACRAGTCSD